MPIRHLLNSGRPAPRQDPYAASRHAQALRAHTARKRAGSDRPNPQAKPDPDYWALVRSLTTPQPPPAPTPGWQDLPPKGVVRPALVAHGRWPDPGEIGLHVGPRW